MTIQEFSDCVIQNLKLEARICRSRAELQDGAEGLWNAKACAFDEACRIIQLHTEARVQGAKATLSL